MKWLSSWSGSTWWWLAIKITAPCFSSKITIMFKFSKKKPTLLYNYIVWNGKIDRKINERMNDYRTNTNTPSTDPLFSLTIFLIHCIRMKKKTMFWNLYPHQWFDGGFHFFHFLSVKECHHITIKRISDREYKLFYHFTVHEELVCLLPGRIYIHSME